MYILERQVDGPPLLNIREYRSFRRVVVSITILGATQVYDGQRDPQMSISLGVQGVVYAASDVRVRWVPSSSGPQGAQFQFSPSSAGVGFANSWISVSAASTTRCAPKMLMHSLWTSPAFPRPDGLTVWSRSKRDILTRPTGTLSPDTVSKNENASVTSLGSDVKVYGFPRLICPNWPVESKPLTSALAGRYSEVLLISMLMGRPVTASIAMFSNSIVGGMDGSACPPRLFRLRVAPEMLRTVSKVELILHGWLAEAGAEGGSGAGAELDTTWTRSAPRASTRIPTSRAAGYRRVAASLTSF